MGGGSHPVKAKAHEGRTKHRLITDPIRGPVVTQIFIWRAVDRLSREEIAGRLNLEPDRYPPPDPILGRGRTRVGAWTTSSVREVLDNPKHTGFMVWNRRKRGHRARGVKGRSNPPSHWIWSPQPTHEALVTKEMFEAASTVSRFRQGSRSSPGPNRHRGTTRTYRLRSYVICDLCGRRLYGCTHKGHTYYRCTADPNHHRHQPWFADHPRAAMVREELLTAPLDALLVETILGTARADLLSAGAPIDEPDAAHQERQKALTEDIDALRRKQENLIKQVEDLEPSGNPDLDAAWRRGLQNRFTALVTEQQAKEEQLDHLRQQTAAPDVDLTILERVPITDIDPTLLPDDLQRELCDAFRLELHYHPLNEQVVVQVAVTAEIGRLINTSCR